MEEHISLSFLPKKLRRSLNPFQKKAIRYAIRKNGRLLIGDEMGLGKTLQAISIACYYRQEWPVLVVAPSSLRYNWVSELETWLPWLQPGDVNMVRSFSDVNAMGDALISIMSYGLLSFSKSHATSRVSQIIAKTNFGVAILDESHYIKNMKSARTREVLASLKQVKRVVLLSGTPSLSRPEELFTQLSLISPATFKDFHTFAKRYCNGHYETTRTADGRLYNTFNTRGASNLKELNQILVKNIMIRRLKSQVLDQLPPKIRTKILFEIPSDNKYKKEITEKYTSIRKVIKDMFEPKGGVAPSRFDYTQPFTELFTATALAKAAAVQKYISDLLDGMENKFLVFCYHLTMVQAVVQTLHNKKVKFIKITGDTPSVQRGPYVDNFQTDPQIRVAVLSIQAASTGLTLTAADHVVFAELHHTPGVLMQAEDRCHRMGQHNAVQIHYLVAHATIDEILWAMLQRKVQVTSAALNGKISGLHMDEEDSSKKVLLSLVDAWEPVDVNAETSQLFQEPKEKPTSKDIRSFFGSNACYTSNSISNKRLALKRKKKPHLGDAVADDTLICLSSDDEKDLQDFKPKRKRNRRNVTTDAYCDKRPDKNKVVEDYKVEEIEVADEKQSKGKEIAPCSSAKSDAAASAKSATKNEVQKTLASKPISKVTSSVIVIDDVEDAWESTKSSNIQSKCKMENLSKEKNKSETNLDNAINSHQASSESFKKMVLSPERLSEIGNTHIQSASQNSSDKDSYKNDNESCNEITDTKIKTKPSKNVVECFGEETKAEVSTEVKTKNNILEAKCSAFLNHEAINECEMCNTKRRRTRSKNSTPKIVESKNSAPKICESQNNKLKTKKERVFNVEGKKGNEDRTKNENPTKNSKTTKNCEIPTDSCETSTNTLRCTKNRTTDVNEQQNNKIEPETIEISSRIDSIPESDEEDEFKLEEDDIKSVTDTEIDQFTSDDEKQTEEREMDEISDEENEDFFLPTSTKIMSTSMLNSTNKPVSKLNIGELTDQKLESQSSEIALSDDSKLEASLTEASEETQSNAVDTYFSDSIDLGLLDDALTAFQSTTQQTLTTSQSTTQQTVNTQENTQESVSTNISPSNVSQDYFNDDSRDAIFADIDTLEPATNKPHESLDNLFAEDTFEEAFRKDDEQDSAVSDDEEMITDDTGFKYKMSYYTNRVFLYDQSGKYLELNFNQQSVGMGVLDHLHPSLLPPKRLRQLQKFTREWKSLGPLQKALVARKGALFESPVEAYSRLYQTTYAAKALFHRQKQLQQKRQLTVRKVSKAKTKEEHRKENRGKAKSFKRFTQKQNADKLQKTADQVGGSLIPVKTKGKKSKQKENEDNALGAELVQAVDSEGCPLCLQCHKKISHVQAGSWMARFCSHICMQDFKVRRKSSRNNAREQLFLVELGVCQMCGVDAHNTFTKIRDAHASERKAMLEETSYTSLPVTILNKMVKTPKEGLFWEADHIQAVSEGGGECGLDNYRTLCTPCHRHVTKELMKRKRKCNQNGGSGSVRDFFKAV